MDVFWRLLFGHLLGDFTCQTNYVAAWKRRSLWGLLFHATTHPVLYVALVWPYLARPWVSTPWGPLNGWTCVALIYVTHLLEDQWRIWSVQRGAPDNLLFYLWDQVIHVVILFAFTPPTGPLVQSKWPLLGSLAVLVTHFATVTVYFVEKDLFGRDFPETMEKYGGMLLRLLVFGCFFLPGWGWLLVAAVWGAWSFLPERFPGLALSRTGWLLGNGLAVVCGLAGRWISFYL